MTHQGSSSIDIDATASEIFAIVADLEAYPDWLEDVTEVEVLERDDEGRVAAARMVVDVAIRGAVSYTLDYDYITDERMSWMSRPGGDVKHIEGSYSFDINDDGGTTVTYELTIDPGFPIPGFMIKKATRHITAVALDGLKQRAEEA